MKNDNPNDQAAAVFSLPSTTQIPGWLEQVALDDLAMSIETWTRQMTDYQSINGADYGTPSN